MCMHAQEVLFQIRSIKKPVMLFKNDRKKLFSLQNVMKKNCLKCTTLLKRLSASLKYGNPPPSIKNNGPSLIGLNVNGL